MKIKFPKRDPWKKPSQLRLNKERKDRDDKRYEDFLKYKIWKNTPRNKRNNL